MKSLLLGCLLSLSLLASAVPPPQPNSFLFGFATHFAQRRENPNPQMQILQNIGAIGLRDEVYWDHVEDLEGNLKIPAHVEDYVTAANQRGIEPILVLGYGHPSYGHAAKPTHEEAQAGFERYASFVVKHFAGRVRWFEIWNEWDIAIGGTEAGKLSNYITLLKRVLPKLRATNPNAQFLIGSFTPQATQKGWLNDLVQSHVISLADGIALHPYNYYESDPTPEALYNKIRHLYYSLKSQTKQAIPPFFITEFGWPSHQGQFGISETQQADFLLRSAVLLSSLPFVKGMWWYNFLEKGNDPHASEENFGILNVDQSLKPAAYAMQQVKKLLHNATAVHTLHTPSKTWAFKIQHPKTQFLVTWSQNQNLYETGLPFSSKWQAVQPQHCQMLTHAKQTQNSMVSGHGICLFKHQAQPPDDAAPTRQNLEIKTSRHLNH